MPRDFQMTFSGIFRVDTHTGNILKKKYHIDVICNSDADRSIDVVQP
jgi:hypothetical protein